VNFSHVLGAKLPPSVGAPPDLGGKPWEAMGVSLVIHPRNPYAPTVHMNVRFFSTTNAAGEPVWWFGGGMDLTPYYGNQEDEALPPDLPRRWRPFGDGLHASFKKWCDEYFYLKHRQEARGVGGIFFDDHNAGGFEQSFAMTQSVGDAFLKAYLPILERARTRPTASANAISRPTGAAAMSNSTWYSTAARCSACSRAAAPKRS
jgi:coproporphyrinogen III oxidase